MKPVVNLRRHCNMNLTFEPINLKKQIDYVQHLSTCPQVTSDCSFLNLWAWAEEYGLRWAWADGLVWIKQTLPDVVMWAPVGPWDKIDWQSKFDAQPNTRLTFIRVPNKLADIWSSFLGDSAVIEEERGHWDYLYSVADLVELQGKRYHKKKNLLNQFNRKYAHTYENLGTELIEHAMAMQADWCTWRDCESSDVLSAENRAVYRILRDWHQLDGTVGGAILVDGSMAAYTIAEVLSRDTLVVHFEKGDTEYKGVYQAINQKFLEHNAQIYSLVNREQDLSDEGLRKAKLSYHPVDFLRKYRVTIAGTFDS